MCHFADYWEYFDQKIDVLGAIVGGLLTLLMFLGFNFAGIGLISIFFVLGSLVSYYKKTEKQELGLEQENKGRRSYIHTLSNAGVAGFWVYVCGFL